MADNDDRAELLRRCFNDEALRRMARKSGVGSVSKGNEHTLNSVNDALRTVADLVLRNVAEKCTAVADGARTTNISERVIKPALDALKLGADMYLYPPQDTAFPPCKSHRQHVASSRARSASRAQRGNKAKQEINFENRDSRDECVYTPYAPFSRLLKHVFKHAQSLADKNYIVSARAGSWIQLIVEGTLIKILTNAQFLMTEFTKGHGVDDKAKRSMLNARDIAAAHAILKDCTPILQGKLEPMDFNPPARPRAKSTARGDTPRADSTPRAKPAAKSKATAKATAKATPASKRKPRSKRAKEADT